MQGTTVGRIAPADRVGGPPTAGMRREQAVLTDRSWGGLVTTEPGMVSDWHHHGDWETTIYVLSGTLRMEFGPGGTQSFEAGPGDFVFVPAGAIHRESNPSTEQAQLIGMRSGRGESVVNVTGPDADSSTA
jgi:uncharacterized RmlC-like cupin family protein